MQFLGAAELESLQVITINRIRHSTDYSISPHTKKKRKKKERIVWKCCPQELQDADMLPGWSMKSIIQIPLNAWIIVRGYPHVTILCTNSSPYIGLFDVYGVGLINSLLYTIVPFGCLFWVTGTVTAVTAAGAIGIGAGIWFFKKVRAKAPVTSGVQANDNRLF